MTANRKAKQRLDFADLTEGQKAYIAGFLDGDGSIVAQFVKKSDYKFGFQIRLSVLWFQKTSRLHHLVDLSNEIGLGQVRKRDDGISEYNIAGLNVLEPFLKALSPYLRIKKKQANLVLKIIEQLPSARDSKEKFLALCPLVDQIANLNDSKNRTITSETVANHLENIDISKLNLLHSSTSPPA